MTRNNRSPKRRKINNSTQTGSNPKDILIEFIRRDLIDDDSDTDDMENQEQYEDKSQWPLKTIYKEINDINDLIELGKSYDPKLKVRYNINLERLNKVVKPLENLRDMIGLDNIKKTIVNQIIYYLSDLENQDMMHTVITGPPGVGKTRLGRIFGDIYYNLGVLEGNKKKRKRHQEDYTFKIVKRSDLIGKYLGHTAVKTQKVIDNCQGGVLFIDEAYSLGNAQGRDSFSKECIDTINQNLTEKKCNFLCIIAGYKDALEKCFFAYNQGLSRRFTFRYNIEKYTAEQLRLILFEMIEKIGWKIDKEKIKVKFFEDNYQYFKNMAGDMETLLFNSKISHSRRTFCYPELRKTLNLDDIQKGINTFNEGRGNKEKVNDTWKYMYL